MSRARKKPQAPIARKLVVALRRFRGNKVVDLDSYKRGAATAEELQKTVVSREDLAGLDPAHAMYAYTQNQLSVLSEQITALDELDRITRPIAAAEEEYMPSGPPMSPLTVSYFTCWALFDAAVGRQKETLGTCILALGKELGMDQGFLDVARLMQRSRMGVFVHEGDRGGRVHLRELVTGAQASCVVPSGLEGKEGELWLVRVLPPPAPVFDHSVVFTTPYVLLGQGERDWEAYFERTLEGKSDKVAGYETLMKYGLERNYWNEFIFEGYVNHKTEAIFLTGHPDVAESRPHSRPSR